MMRPPDSLTIEEAAELTGLRPQLLHHAVYQKQLAVLPERLKPGDRLLLARADVLAWTEARAEKRARRERLRAEKEALQEKRREARATQGPGPGTNAGCQRHSAEWAELLKKTREERQLTITEVGRRAQTCQSYISRMEALGEIPRRDKVLAVARALEADPNTFLLICGYAPEETTHLAQLLNSLAQLPPAEQMQMAEVTEVYVRCPLPRRQEFLDLVRCWWRESPRGEAGGHKLAV